MSGLRRQVPAGTVTGAGSGISVGLLGAAAFVVTADVRVITPILDVIAREFKSDIGSTGFMVTAYTIPYGLFQLVYGPLGDYVGKLKIMTFAMALFAVGTAICGLAPNLLVLDLLRFLTGVAAAAIIPMSLAYIGDTFPYAQRQAAIGRFLGAVALGQILSTSLGGIAGEYLSWRYIFFLYGLVSIAIFVMLWRTLRVTRDQVKRTDKFSLAAFKPYYQLLTQPAPRLVIVAVFIEGLFFFGGFTYLGAFLKNHYNLRYDIVGFILGGFGVGSLIYSRSVKWLVQRFGENGLILLGGTFAFVCYLITALVNSWELFIAVNIFLGLGYYMIHSTLQTKATELAPGARGTAVSLFAFNLFLGQGIGAAVLGVVADVPNTGYQLAFIISGIGMVLLAVWFVWRARRFPANSDKSTTNPAELETSVIITD